MKIFIAGQQKTDLECLYDSSRDKRVCNCIKAILLISEDGSSTMIAL